MTPFQRFVVWLRVPGRIPLLSLIAVILAVTYVPLWVVTIRSFDNLEQRENVDEAEELRVAPGAQLQRLSDFGMTNAIWTALYDDIRRGDQAHFAIDVPGSVVGPRYGMTAVIGTDLTGEVRVGGAIDGSAYTALPGALREPSTLRTLFDPGASADTGKCGFTSVTGAPTEFCGFPAYPDAGTPGGPSGGLLLFRELNAAALAEITEKTNDRLTVRAQPRPGREHGSLTASYGPIGVRTAVVDTAESTERITATLGALTASATEVSRAVATMTDTIGSVRAAIGQVRTVADGQQHTISGLMNQVQNAIGQIEDLGDRQQPAGGGGSDLELF
ncbi:hypothetical protein ACWT_5039 [Actinoplanes sp. SE50]|uniref:CHASE4 domain-containing protein n=1 Tax=unclassified Actinoplanes TaxID=2626549 RepID=UPI00023ECEF4|nr:MULTISPECIES: CHASE4 domain-containing protein [unclassified Actinoplanes]AEV86056.1 hypothetical protein ACPL_5169 [Actinoplanes sp. SE50/110]ATO84454.1 hypothetical protein ACWT_5039 [Actinoplanes sp. SE50]SLM01864.1 hypothetical protein ACSP50_5102 [Actinoplanes sp. SE50/110]